MMIGRTTLLLAASTGLALTAGSASALTIASQDFNSLDSTGTFTNQTLPDGTVNGALTNAGASNSGGPGLDFQMFWTDTSPSDSEGGPVASNESSDFIGVNSFTGFNSPDVAPGGAAISAGVEHNLEFNDGDGRLSAVFETVDVTGFTNVQVSLNYWANSTTWEADDSIIFLLSDGTTNAVTSFTGVAIDGIESADDGTDNWQSLTFDYDTEGFTGNLLTLTVAIDNDSGSENFFIDNVAFTGVPEPASLALLGLGGLTLLRRRG